MGKSTGICAGLGGSQHLCGERFFKYGIQGGIVPVSAGIAMSHKLAGNGAITAVCIGDGTLGEGVLYETLNLASKWRLPLLVMLENNGYAQSTSQLETMAGISVPVPRRSGSPPTLPIRGTRRTCLQCLLPPRAMCASRVRRLSSASIRTAWHTPRAMTTAIRAR